MRLPSGLILLYRIVPESPRWLIIQGRLKEARAIISQVGRENVRQEVPDHLLTTAAGDSQAEGREEKEKRSLLSLLRSPRLGLRTLNMCYQVTPLASPCPTSHPLSGSALQCATTASPSLPPASQTIPTNCSSSSKARQHPHHVLTVCCQLPDRGPWPRLLPAHHGLLGPQTDPLLLSDILRDLLHRLWPPPGNL